jgi:uncharacterized protein YdeI (BOF family)
VAIVFFTLSKEVSMRSGWITTALLIGCMSVALSAAESPYTKLDGSWISLNGTVVSAGPASFELDYGQGLVTVEMDDWDWYQEGRNILEGDEVTVYGRVDDDLYEVTSIEASSVYVKDLNTYFYASAADEESEPYIVTTWVTDYDINVSGEVTSINGREFTIDTGNRKLTIDTYQMPYNPLDKYGYQKIGKGDYVSVSGNMDYDFLEDKELVAESIVTMIEDLGSR